MENNENNKTYVNITFDSDEGAKLKDAAGLLGIKLTPFCKQAIIRFLNTSGIEKEKGHLTLPSLKHIIFYIMGVALFTFLIIISTIYLTLWAYISMAG